MFYFHPYLGKISILTNIFQMGWNHQPVLYMRHSSQTWVPRLGATDRLSRNPLACWPPRKTLRKCWRSWHRSCGKLVSWHQWRHEGWVGRPTSRMKSVGWIFQRSGWIKELMQQVATRWLYGCFQKQWYLQIIHFNRVFHYKPSILGVPLFLETSISFSFPEYAASNWIISPDCKMFALRLPSSLHHVLDEKKA